MRRSLISSAILSALVLSSNGALAQSTSSSDSATEGKPASTSTSVTATSNTTTANDTQRTRELKAVNVTGSALSLGGGYMQYQSASKAVSTVSREAILQSNPSNNFTQVINSMPGVVSATDDATGLMDGYFSVRGFPMDEVGVFVDGVPVNDSSDYAVYASEYGDAENIGDITVEPGYADVGAPVLSAVGGTVAWVSMAPLHQAKLDVSTGFGSNNYRRQFIRYNTGDLGNVRAWVSYSHNETDQWRGPGHIQVEKIDGKAIWDISETASITAALQYNREMRSGYRSLTKSQAQANYFTGYDRLYDASNPTNYYRLSGNPFRSWALSLDGEFQVGDFTHISIVPYFWYGYGGGSWSELAEWETGTFSYQGSSVSGSDPMYMMWRSNTHRPGIHFKVKHDLTDNYSLTYGVWHEEPRNSSAEVYYPVSSSGEPSDIWAQDDSLALQYSSGAAAKYMTRYAKSQITKLFVSNAWTPTDALELNLGANYTHVRRDIAYAYLPGSGSADAYAFHSSASYDKFSPTAGAKYQIDEQNQVYLGLSKSYRAPSVPAVKDYLAQTYLGNDPASLKGESASTADLGWRYNGEAFNASASAYATNFKNKEVAGTLGNGMGEVYLTFPAMQLRGVTAEASYQFDPQWNLYTSYTHVKTTIKGNLDLGDGSTYATNGKAMLNAPENALYAAVNFKQGPLWASLNAKYTSSIWGDWSNTEKVGGYTTLNLSGGWNFHDWGFAKSPYIKLNVANLANRKALTYATNTAAYLASESSPTYVLLQDRFVSVNLGLSFY
jgi:iron complex outermembrane recepter protein